MLLALSIAGCTDNIIKSYDTYEKAVEDGVISKGWMPSYYPKSANNILLAANLDTNLFVLKSEITKGDTNGFIANCKSEQSNEEIKYFDDVRTNEKPSFLRFVCDNGSTFVEILNEQYVFYSNNF